MIYLLAPDLIMRTRGTEREEKDKKNNREYGENNGMRDENARMRRMESTKPEMCSAIYWQNIVLWVERRIQMAFLKWRRQM